MFEMVKLAEENPVYFPEHRESDQVIYISKPSWRAAEGVVSYFVRQMQIYYDSKYDMERYFHSVSLVKWLVEKLSSPLQAPFYLKEGFTPRDIQQTWGKQDKLDSAACESVCKNLVQHGYLYVKDDFKPARSDSYKFWVNPEIVKYADFDDDIVDPSYLNDLFGSEDAKK